jgi:Mg-chelatase subunit ChlD/LysM repeat protein
MNPDQPSREHIEARLTALLLGELPADEAELLRYTIARDPALKQLHDELAATIVLVREAINTPADAPAQKTEPLKLSNDRREKLLAHFQTAPKDEPLFWLKRIESPRFVTALICIALVGLLAAVSIPNFVKSRATSPANTVMNNLRQIDAAKNQWALENNKSSDAVPTSADLSPYLKDGGVKPVAGESYVIGKVSGPVIAEADTKQAREKLGTDMVMLPSDHEPQIAMAEKPVAPSTPAPMLAPPPQPVTIALPAAETSPVGSEANPASSQIAAVDTDQIATTVNSKTFGAVSGGGGAGGETYVIKPGDTLSEIALEHGTTVKALKEANNLSSSKILAGAKMKLPGTTEVLVSSPGVAAMPPQIDPATGLPVANGPGGVYSQHVVGYTDQFAVNDKDSAQHSSDRQERMNRVEKQWVVPAQNQPEGSQRVQTVGTVNAFSGGNFHTWDADNSDKEALGVNNGTIAPGGNRAGGSGGGGGGGSFAGTSGNYGGIALGSSGTTFAVNGVTPLPSMGGEATVDSFGAGRSRTETAPQSPAADFSATVSGQGGSSPSPDLAVAAPSAPAAMPLGQFPGVAQAELPKDETKTRKLDAANSDQLKTDGTRRFYREPESEKLVILGDVPVTGQLLTNPSSSIATAKTDGKDIGLEWKLGEVITNGLVVTDGSVNKPGASTLALNGANAFAGKSSDRDDVWGLKDRFLTNAVAVQTGVGGTINSSPGVSALTPVETDRPLPKSALPPLIPQPEILCSENNFSTFALNVSDVSFQLAAASLERGQLPDPASIRSEEFINAFDYRDPEAAAGQPLAFAAERARYPFAQNRDLLRLSVKAAAVGRPAGRALNLVVLLDISGSMERADRVAIIHEALRVLASQLQPQDTVSVVTFSRTARLWADGISGDKAGETLDRVGGITPEGGTNLEEAMRLAYATARRHYLANGLNRVVLLTDGAANLGDVDPGGLRQNVETQRKQGIALDCFGVGFEDYNDDLLEQLSSHGDGRYAFLNSPEDASKEFAAKLAGALQIAAQDVKVQVEFNPQRVVSWRQIGYATHQLTKQQFRDNTVAAGEIAAQEAGNALYTVQTKPDGVGPIATVRVRYRVPGTQDYQERSWLVGDNGTAPALADSSPAMRLAATASAFSEWLATSPFAQEVTLDELQKLLDGVPPVYGADERPKKLETMLREAKSISGK